MYGHDTHTQKILSGHISSKVGLGLQWGFMSGLGLWLRLGRPEFDQCRTFSLAILALACVVQDEFGNHGV